MSLEAIGWGVKYCTGCSHAEFLHPNLEKCKGFECCCTFFLVEEVCAKPDPVNHPPHYNKHPSGVECIVVTEHMNFCLGNAIKYIWRAGEKGSIIEDLKKAQFYLDREIRRLEKFGVK